MPDNPSCNIRITRPLSHIFVVCFLLCLTTSGDLFAASWGDGQAQELVGKPQMAFGPSDEISVRVSDFDEISDKPIRIDGEGFISLPFAGRVQAGGLRPSELEVKITERLAAYLKNPRVTVNVISLHSQPVSILGAVNKPGVYQLEGGKDVVEALSLAGGLRPDAGSTLRITRQTSAGALPVAGARTDLTEKFQIAELDLDDLIRAKRPELNIMVRPRDVITVAKADLVYVIGDVRKPGGFMVAAHERLSLLQSLAMAEGLERTAAPKRARILRAQSDRTERKEIPVDIAGIMSGKQTDIYLQPNDVLFVPNNTARSLGMRTAEVALQLGTGILIYRR